MKIETLLSLEAASLYVAGVAVLGLAGWLVAIDPQGRINRAFALFLFARGGGILAGAASTVAGDAEMAELAARVAFFAHLASIGALLHFLSVYPRTTRFFGQRPLGTAAIAAGTLVLLAVYAAWPCSARCAVGGANAWGPLAIATAPLLMGIAAAALLPGASHASPAPQRSSLLLVGGIFALNALFDGLRGAVPLTRALLSGELDAALVGSDIASVWTRALRVSPVAVLVLAALALGFAYARTDDGATRRRLVIASGVAVASALIVALVGSDRFAGVSLFVLGLWRLAVPAVVTYGILRHQLFSLDQKVRVGISQGTLAAAFLFVFVGATQAAQEYLNAEHGYLAGALAAGLLFFGIQPLQRISARVGGAAVPSANKTESSETTYRVAVEMALADGDITRAEERHLATIATRLGIDAARAFALRDEVEDGAVARAPPNGGAG